MDGIEIPRYNYKKYVKIFGAMLAVSIIYGFFLFPVIMKTTTKALLKLKPGAKLREEIYLPIPLDISFKVYLWNITNPDQVQKGSDPVMQEVGPYVFSERKFKYDAEDDDEADTLAFNLRNTFYFDEKATAPLTGNEIIVFPHMVIMAGLIVTQREQAPLLPVAIKGINIIFNNPDNPFWIARAYDLMFDGYPINCDVEEFEAEAICSVLEDALGETGKYNDTHLGFSFFKAGNGTNAGRFKVFRGVKDIADVGRMVEFNEEPELDTYDGDECNELKGTDGLFFPPFLKKTQKVWAFASPICRSIATWYEQKTSYKGVALSKFVTHFNSTHDCYCRDSDRDNCPPDGTIELAMCLQAPLIGSKPHFYDADPALLEHVKGLSPDKENHDTHADFDLFSGSPMNAAQRLQFNLDMGPVESFPPMENLPQVIVPLFWVEEAISLNSTFVKLFKFIHGNVNFTKFVKIFGFIFGIVGLPISVFLMMNGPEYVENDVNVVKTSTHEEQRANAESDIILAKNMRNNILQGMQVDASNKNLVMPQTKLNTIPSGKEN